MILQPPQGRRTIPVDFIRDLIAKISLRPALAEGRVFLIDEAHLLSEEGANALLKTLEEPPEGSALILVTDRCKDLLPTILSRSRVVRFRPANFGACCAYLQDKGIGFEEAQVAAAMALGSPGRAEAVLESPLFRGRAEVADAILDLTTERLCTTADRLWALSVSETRMPLEARRRALLDLLDFLIVFAWDGARAGWGGTVRNRDLGTALTRARIVAPQRWEAVALRLFEAKRQVLANVVPALVLDAALADVSSLLKPLD
jgi:DNA polymerase-3 subunit delta'